MEPQNIFADYFLTILQKNNGSFERTRPQKVIIDCDPGADDG